MPRHRLRLLTLAKKGWEMIQSASTISLSTTESSSLSLVNTNVAELSKEFAKIQHAGDV